MTDDITVVSVVPGDTKGVFSVTFSQPIYLWYLPHFDRDTCWWASDGNGRIIPDLDELGAYLWGLKVIEKHKEMENDKRP